MLKKHLSCQFIPYILILSWFCMCSLSKKDQC